MPLQAEAGAHGVDSPEVAEADLEEEASEGLAEEVPVVAVQEVAGEWN